MGMTDYQHSPFVQAYPENGEFWAAAAEGTFLLKRCKACEKAHWYPRIVCPLCGSDDLHWVESSGRGTIYSYSVVERADPSYVLVYVRLDDGPIILSNLLKAEPDQIRIGAAVQAHMMPIEDGRTLPFFQLAE